MGQCSSVKGFCIEPFFVRGIGAPVACRQKRRSQVIAPLEPTDLLLETERLILRPFTADDVDIAMRVLCDPEVMRYVAEPMTPEAVAAHMSNAVRRGAGGRIGIWSVTRKDTGQKIGDGALLPIPIDEEEYDWGAVVPEAYPAGDIEVGYLTIPEAWGNGYATEICARLLRFAFEKTQLSEIMAVTDPENARSQNVLCKCGLRPIGRRKAFAEENLPWFRITRADWTSQASNQWPSGSPG